MPGNEDRSSSGLSDAASQALPSPSQVAGSATNDQEVSRDDFSAETGDPRPPLGVKLTYYRLLYVTTGILGVVLTAVLSIKNQTIAAAIVSLLSGSIGIVLYVVGLFEQQELGRNGKRFFQDDLAPVFGRSMKRFVGGVVWAVVRAPSFFRDMLVVHPFISLFLLCVCLMLARFLPVWGAAVVSIGFTSPVVVIFMGLVVRASSGRS
ncbi:hypothetical protein BJY52DRAFT_1305871 [Lactarius psammicola]|nr:hypothetical protein BJY52DRAFT_1305871 [Lactarius psammicola]